MFGSRSAASKKCVAVFFIFLVLGHHVAQADRVVAFEAAARRNTSLAGKCPLDDSGCHHGFSSGCSPAECCIYKSGITNIGKRCVLDFPYKPDDYLIGQFGRRTRDLFYRVDAFRHQGGLSGLVNFWASDALKSFKRIMEVVQASPSTENGPKTYTARAVDAYYSVKGLNKFSHEFAAIRAESGFDFKVFSTGRVDIPFQFDADAASYDSKATAHEWVTSSLREGLVKIREAYGQVIPESYAAKIDKLLAEMDRAQARGDDGGAEALGLAMEEAIPPEVGDEDILDYALKQDVSELKKYASMIQLGGASSELAVATDGGATIGFLLLLLLIGTCVYVFISMATTKVRATGTVRGTSDGGYTGHARVTQRDIFGEQFNGRVRFHVPGRRA